MLVIWKYSFIPIDNLSVTITNKIKLLILIVFNKLILILSYLLVFESVKRIDLKVKYNQNNNIIYTVN